MHHRKQIDAKIAYLRNRIELLRKDLTDLDALLEPIESYVPYLCGKKTVHSDRKDEILANIRGIEAVLALDSSIENRLCSLQRDLADLAATFYDLSGLLEDAAPDAEQRARALRRRRA